jgi:hypothetical protein
MLNVFLHGPMIYAVGTTSLTVHVPSAKMHAYKAGLFDVTNKVWLNGQLNDISGVGSYTFPASTAGPRPGRQMFGPPTPYLLASNCAIEPSGVSAKITLSLGFPLTVKPYSLATPLGGQHIIVGTAGAAIARKYEQKADVILLQYDDPGAGFTFGGLGWTTGGAYNLHIYGHPPVQMTDPAMVKMHFKDLGTSVSSLFCGLGVVFTPLMAADINSTQPPRGSGDPVADPTQELVPLWQVLQMTGGRGEFEAPPDNGCADSIVLDLC